MKDDATPPVTIELPEPAMDESIERAEAAPAAPAAALAIADGEDHRVDRKVVTVDRIGAGIRTTILGGVTFVVALIVTLANDPPAGVRLAIFLGRGLFALLLVLQAIFWPALAYRYTSYRVTDAFFRFRHGVLWRSVISVPKSRVQHTDVSQGPIERQFGLATLTVHTAGTEHASVSLDGLPHATALAIRDHLIGGGDDDAV